MKILVSITFSMLVSELESLNQAECLVYWATDRQVVDGDLTKPLLFVNDEKTTECQSLILLVYTIGLWNGSWFVG